MVILLYIRKVRKFYPKQHTAPLCDDEVLATVALTDSATSRNVFLKILANFKGLF